MLLFDVKPSLPDGFVYIDDFISAQEEKELIDFIRSIDLHAFMFQGHEAKRRVASFGYNYNFEHRSLLKGEPIPVELHAIVAKVAGSISIPHKSFGELLITEYPIGSVINWHRDAMPFGIVAGVSMLSDCSFKLRPYNKEQRNRKNTITVKVKRRSLYVMSGASRHEWQHSTAPVESVRYSITLRTLKE